ALSAPLNFLAGAPVAAVARTQFPAQAFAARGQALLPQVQNAPLRQHLQALCTVLSGYNAASPPQQRADIQHCRELVERIRAMSGGPPPVYRRSAAAVAEDLIALAQSVQFVRGVGPRRADQFKKLGIATVEDLLYHLPFRYEDRRALSTVRAARVGEVVSIIG